MAQFDGTMNLKRREVLALAFWRLGGNSYVMEQAVKGIEGPAAWGNARRQIKKALATANATAALDCLLDEQGGIPGWGVTMASAVLAVCRPHAYTVADPRALRTLKTLGILDPHSEDDFTRDDWWPYLRECRKLAELCGLSLREVSQALWAAADDAPALPNPRRRARPHKA